MSEQLAALQVAYADLASIVSALDEPMSWRPSGCAGWAVRDLVFHLLSDAQRALVALATPAPGAVVRDAVTYWVDSPGRSDPYSRELRSVRTIASAWRLDHLTQTYVETTRAVLWQAQRVPMDTIVATQSHALSARDLMTTLTVEGALHHLDLVANLDLPGPRPGPLALVRQTLDGLLGRPVPVSWDDATWARAGTGRRALEDGERAILGADATGYPC